MVGKSLRKWDFFFFFWHGSVFFESNWLEAPQEVNIYIMRKEEKGYNSVLFFIAK